MRTRLFLSFALVVLVSITVVVLVARQSTTNEVREFMFRRGVSEGESLVVQLADFYEENNSWDGVEQLFLPRGQAKGRGQGNQPSDAGLQFRVADVDGTIVYQANPEESAASLSSKEMGESVAITVDNQTVGYLYAEGGTGGISGEETLLLERLNRAAITAAVVAGVLSMLIALYLAYRLLRPVRELTRTVERLGAGDLSERAQVHGNDEVAVLARTFNQMADSLQRAEQSRRAMTADIAHELRNPLAVQRANLEAFQDGIYPLTPENLEPVIEQNSLLSRLVEDLRTLALADAGQLELEKSETDLVVLSQAIVDRYKPQALVNSVVLHIDSADNEKKRPCTILIDRVRFEQIMGNLISNALRYTPQGGEIDLNLLCTDQKVTIEIHDSGTGIPEDALPYIFDRFYRGDRSRSRNGGGTGLGLAIARQLVEAHGGELTARNHPQGGALFTVTFPRSIDAADR